MNRSLIISCSVIFLCAAWSNVEAQTHVPSWHQSVHYWIDVELDPIQRIAYGKEKIIYTNHSPDTLTVLYLNLYVNAFKKTSHMEAYQNERNQYEGGSLISQLDDRYLGYNNVRDVRNGKGDFLDFEIDDTILKITLDEPLLPGVSATISMDFELKVPWLMRRMGWRNREGVEFSMAQWYPKLCVYDQKGWHRNYYLGREFYGEFATFDVSITLPESYVVGATGHLQNAEDIGAMTAKDPAETLGDRLFQSAFAGNDSGPAPANKELESVLSEFSKIMKQQKGPKLRTWRYHAEKVHDFAWCADPDYIYEKVDHQGVRIHLLYQPDVADKWKEMKIWTVQILDFMNTRVGVYPYEDFTIAQAGDGGMEYPNIVFITGDRDRKSLASVTAHEMAHNWFYGLIANNETMEAWLDEGITSYYTTRLMEHLFGRYANIDYTSPFQQKWYPKEDARTATYAELEWWIKQGYEEKALQHADFFKSDRSHLYTVYYKGEVFMFTLQYYFGRDKLDELMRRFYATWRQNHVYTEDMKRFFEKETGIELDWLFEEWLNTTESCDYAIKKTSSRRTDQGSYETEVLLKRHGFIEMPLDVALTLDNDSVIVYRIPSHPDDPDIPGYIRQPVWNKVSTDYGMYVELDHRVKRVDIDTTLLLPDVNRMNNSSAVLPKTDWRFKWPARVPPTLNSYLIEHRPSVWYNSVDAVRVGYQFNGKWATDEYRLKAGLYYGIDSRTVDYDIGYSTPLYNWGRQIYLDMSSYRLEGRSENSIGITKRLYNTTLYRPPIHTFRTAFRSSDLFDSRYLVPGIFWDNRRVNTVLLEWVIQTRLYDSPRLKTDFETTIIGSKWNFSKAYISGQWPINLVPRHVKLIPSMFGGYASGSVPPQERFYIAGASPRQMFENKFFRSRGTLPNALWMNRSDGSRHVYYDGEGSMSGYADSNLFAKRIMTVNADLWFRNPVSYVTSKNIFFVTQFVPYVFYDIGLLWNDNRVLRHNLNRSILMDSGLGAIFRLPLPNWMGSYVIRSEFPFWVSKPEKNGHDRSVAFRWLIGLSNEF